MQWVEIRFMQVIFRIQETKVTFDTEKSQRTNLFRALSDEIQRVLRPIFRTVELRVLRPRNEQSRYLRIIRDKFASQIMSRLFLALRYQSLSIGTKKSLAIFRALRSQFDD